MEDKLSEKMQELKSATIKIGNSNFKGEHQQQIDDKNQSIQKGERVKAGLETHDIQQSIAEKTTDKTASKLSGGEIMEKAMNRALGGGIAGAAAMGLQVCSLMWMRTIMNYQVRLFILAAMCL